MLTPIICKSLGFRFQDLGFRLCWNIVTHAHYLQLDLCLLQCTLHQALPAVAPDALVLADVPPPALLTPASYAVVLADAGAPALPAQAFSAIVLAVARERLPRVALLAAFLLPQVLAQARPFTILTSPKLSPVRADAYPPALPAPAPLALVLAERVLPSCGAGNRCAAGPMVLGCVHSREAHLPQRLHFGPSCPNVCTSRGCCCCCCRLPQRLHLARRLLLRAQMLLQERDMLCRRPRGAGAANFGEIKLEIKLVFVTKS